MTSKEMAYGNIELGTPSNIHRIERGFPFLRRGVNITAIPQFKGLDLYPPAHATAPAVFQQTVVNVNTTTISATPTTFNTTIGARTRWPVASGNQTTQAK